MSRATVDRAAHRRSVPDVVTAMWAHEATHVLLVHRGRLGVRRDGDAVELDLRSPADLAGIGLPVQDGAPGPLCVLLGESADTAFLAVVLPDDAPRSDDTPRSDDAARPDGAAEPGGPQPGGPQPGGPQPGELRTSEQDAVAALATSTTWATLREVGHRLSDRDAGLAAAAVGLAAWHERHPMCPVCGAPTVPAQAGWTRRCTVEGSDHYPRTDPAVIMAVLDADDRLLLGHAAHWPERRFSTLAGYVEPGESLEAAVRREVAEEVGVVVDEVTYQGSQPWPFPASLMVGFVARARTTDVHVDGQEVTDARWFTRADLGRAVDAGEVLLPMRTSIARALIEDWYGQRLGPTD